MIELEAVKALAALAHEGRLRVFRALVVAGADGLTPGALSEQLDFPGTRLSFHLKELANAQLVTQERQGRNLVYRAVFERMNGLVAYLTENCCRGVACDAAPEAPAAARRR